jgi:tripartite-type tricarboxylate transporter receptor subunit TctC
MLSATRQAQSDASGGRRYISGRSEVIFVALRGSNPGDLMPAYAGANSYYPDRPIQIYVPFAAGSASDVITRILLGRMATSLGQNFVVENRPGAGGNTGTGRRRPRRADGYTLVMSTSGPLAANKALSQGTRLRSTKGFFTNLFVRHYS